MLSLELMILGLVLAVLGLALGLDLFRKGRRAAGVAVAYLSPGFFGVAMPLATAISATSPIGILVLTLIWPIWLLQNPLGFSIAFPEWLAALMFSFD